MQEILEKMILGKKDSNLQPSDSESDALPVKLFPILNSCRILYKSEIQYKIPGTGLEPAHLTALRSKRSVSTNSTIPALKFLEFNCGGWN